MLKRGELTTQQIVILIVAITSFIILIFLFGRLNFGKNSQQEICRNSVLMKAGKGISKGSFLNCHTNYVCITADGTCEGMVKPVVKKVKNLNEIYDILANEMADCWWMFGEGKVDYVGKDATKHNYCSICSQVLFDDSLNKLKGVENVISKDKLYDYLSKKKFSNEKMTYAEYLFGTKDMNQLRTLVFEKQHAGNNFGRIVVGKQYFIVMGITSEISGWKWVFSGSGLGALVGTMVVASVSVSNPIGWGIIAGAIVAGGVAGGTAGKEIADSFEPEIIAIQVEGKGIPNRFIAPTILEVNSDKFKALNCEEIITFS